MKGERHLEFLEVGYNRGPAQRPAGEFSRLKIWDPKREKFGWYEQPILIFLRRLNLLEDWKRE